MSLPAPRNQLHSAVLAAILIGLSGPAAAQDADVTAGDTPSRIGFEPGEIVATGSNMDEATLRAILAGDIAANAQALAGLEAESIAFPRMVVSFEYADRIDTVTYSDVVFSDIADGLAASVSVGSTELDYGEAATGTLGTLGATGFDIAGILAFYGLVPSDDPDAFRPLYSDIRFAGGEISFEEGECVLGEATTGPFHARPMRMPFTDLLALIEEIEAADEDDVPPDLAVMLGTIYGDLLTSFKTSEMRLETLACSGVGEDGEAFDVTLGPLVIGEFTPGHYPPFTVANLALTVTEDGDTVSVSADEATFKGFDYTGLVETISSMPSDPDDEWFEANAHRMMPNLEGFSASGITARFPDPDTGIMVDLSLAAFDLDLGNYINNIPTRISSHTRNLVMDLAPFLQGPDVEPSTVAILEAFGLDTLDLSYVTELEWDAERETINVDRLSVHGVGAGEIAISGTIINATEDLFSLDETRTMVAAMDLGLTTLKIEITDEGLRDLMVTIAASNQGEDPEKFRADFLDGAGFMLGAVLAGTSAESIAPTLDAFLEQGGTLVIEGRARAPGGVGAIDLIPAEADPLSLLEKFDVKASLR